MRCQSLSERPTGSADCQRAESRLKITVVFTSIGSDACGLRTAGTLANQLDARITSWCPQVVSYQLPLDKPPVSADGTRDVSVCWRREPGGDGSAILSVPRPGRDTRQVLKPHSLVVLGGKKHWWPTRGKPPGAETAAPGPRSHS